MDKRSVKDLDVKGKKVFLRVDFNVPLDESGNIRNDSKIKAAFPTIYYLQREGAALIIASHLGRPKGQRVEKYSLAPVAKHLQTIYDKPVKFAPDCTGPEVVKMAGELQPGEILLLENLRFHPEEEKNDPAFAKQLASLADVYVNDAFGTAHRAHASTAGVPSILPSAAGFLMEKELEYLGKALEHPARPFVTIVGGAKIADKIGIVKNLLNKVDTLIIGGGMANTFLEAQGYSMGQSLVEKDMIDEARAILDEAQSKGVKFLLPVDVVAADKVAADAAYEVVDVDKFPQEKMAVDIGPKTDTLFAEALRDARTVVWNGPVGVFEIDAFAEGTKAVAKAVAEANAISIIGGGESAAAIQKVGLAGRVSHISTGGGASLEFLEGKTLPGVAALSEREMAAAR